MAAPFLLVAAGARPARAALDLTGTWEGTWSCKDVSNGAVTKPKNTLTMNVTQSGDDVHAFITWNGVNSWDTFQGHVQELTGKPGQGAATILTCAARAGSSEYAEMLSGMVKVSPTNAKPANATFKATSTYELAPGTVGGVCKYSLKRVSLVDPGIAACPVPAVCGNGTIESPETCEVGNLNGKTCQTQGFAGGTLSCAAGCALDTGGCWATRFADNGDGTVTDHLTRLQWHKTTDDGTLRDRDNEYDWCAPSGSACANPANPPDGTVFTVFLAGLNGGTSADGSSTSGCFAGHCDWRIPTIEELAGIIDSTKGVCAGGFGACLDQDVFGPVDDDYPWYWSSSSYTDGRFAWKLKYYSFPAAQPGHSFKYLGPGYAAKVRAVRSAD